jgi:2-polyprenyl-3-methyl-5-hydroxy-6-metoxy-1,4-benzoquinol methylase
MTVQSGSRRLRAAWPADGLERIGHCPICGAGGRDLLHPHLIDRIFFTAPGEWTMWQCRSCRSGYLDPRPTPDTIALAYGDYYTHRRAAERSLSVSPMGRFRNALGNDYRNARFNSRFSPALPLIGRLVVKLFPQVRRRIDLEYRFLPPLRSGARLLDVGCGNGDFLRTAVSVGWQVAGVEPDSEAREVAGAGGVEVRGSLHDWNDAAGLFDYVTASHVIEHVHDPDEFLSEVARLLVPGGRLYVQTPSIDAPTHRRFGPYWRGLEPPRHLVLFNHRSLANSLTKAGFEIVRSIAVPEAAEFLIEQSQRIAQGLDPYSGRPALAAPPPIDGAPPLAGSEDFLTFIAEKRA